MKYKQGLMRYTQNVKCKNEIHSEIKKCNQINSGIFAVLQNAKRLALCKKVFLAIVFEPETLDGQ